MNHRPFSPSRLAWMTAIAMPFMLPAYAHDNGQADAAQGACSSTAYAAAKACQNEAKADAWLAVGNCENETDAEGNGMCVQESWDAFHEAESECQAQNDARLEVCAAIGEDAYQPQIDPANFVDPTQIGGAVAPNPYFPLVPGTMWTYESEDETVTVEVTEETREILGVTTVVVRDTVEEDGEVTEDTSDWYAQDMLGNVWYFGEVSQAFEDGRLASLEGSWEAGVDGAQPGIVMPIDPQVGDVYRQEFLLGEAEDIGEIIDTAGTESVPAASCDGTCLVTEDTSPLEPDAVEQKYYAPDIGLILEVTPDGENRVELVDFQQ